MVNIAILGAGGIATQLARTFAGMRANGNESLSLYAVAARNLERAEQFAKEYGFQKAYGSYEEMVNDPEVTLVYIATPHSHHYEQIKLCLEHGKHVLCEKSFTVNAKQAQEVTAMARAKQLLLAEAIWTRYMPSRVMIDQLIKEGAIGKPHMLTGNLAYKIDHVHRIQQPSLAGGALLDVGVYPINFASMVFGNDIVKIDSSVQMMPTGVDRQESMTLQYADGRMAVLCASASCIGDRQGIVYGDQGTLVVENVNNPQKITVTSVKNGEREVRTFDVPPQITGYEYQVEACIRAIEQKQVECPEMPHSEIVRVMQIMDELRSQWGLVYPCE